MKKSDQYHKWVDWSDEDQAYIGKCPDLITGIHRDDPVRLYGELCEVVEDVIRHFEAEGRALYCDIIPTCGCFLCLLTVSFSLISC